MKVRQSAPAQFECSESFSDVDQLSEATRAWDLDVTQLERGPFEGSLRQVLCGQVLVSHISFNRRVELRACAPPGTRTFGLHLAQPAHWCGARPNETDLQTHAGGEEVHVITPTEYDAILVTVGDVYLSGVCERLGIEGLIEQNEIIKVLSCPKSQTKSLYNAVKNKVFTSEADRFLHEQKNLEEFLNVLVPQICRTASSGRRSEWNYPTSLRRKVLEEAKEYIEYFGDDPPTISDLCRVAKVSERTLHYCFLEEFGVTPMAYTKAHRLNAAHKALRRSGDSKTKIADIANRWGFWHMGQFAADYRNMFGELPSKTLQNNATTFLSEA